jgi:hypothetical protein
MLLLAALAHLLTARARQPDSGSVQWNSAVGHVGLGIITLVYVLIRTWQS